MIVSVSTSRMEDAGVPRPEVDGDPDWLTPGLKYFAHAVAVDAHGEAFVCVREPTRETLIPCPLFYSARFLTFSDRRIPEWYEFVVQEHNRFQQILIAPPFWTRDPTFYENLLDAHKDETGGVVKVFREHIERVRQSLDDDSIIV